MFFVGVEDVVFGDDFIDVSYIIFFIGFFDYFYVLRDGEGGSVWDVYGYRRVGYKYWGIVVRVFIYKVFLVGFIDWGDGKRKESFRGGEGVGFVWRRLRG